jgi:uncharacterized membrane protein
MIAARRSSMVPPTYFTQAALFVIVVAISGSALLLIWNYTAVPWLLPVHFNARGIPTGWQYKTVLRVFLPVFIQLALAGTLGGIGLLLLSRRHGEQDASMPDVKAASVAAEAVLMIAAIWVTFQGYAAYALVTMWISEYGALGQWYYRLAWIGVLMTAVVGVRAHRTLGRPDARPFIAAHWRFGQLYNNADDPALFVPTRDGSRWTLNFGRRVAVALLAMILAAGIVAPTVILVLILR